MYFTTDKLNIGDIAYGSFGRDINVRKGTVISKTATGVVKVRFDDGREDSFLSSGRIRGGGTWSMSYLIDEATYLRLVDISDRQKAARQANAAIAQLPQFVQPSNADATTQAAIIAALEKAIALVRAVPVIEGE